MSKQLDASSNNAEAAADPVFGAAVFVYTRSQAIADGVLVDVTETGREAGIRFPVAVTRALWERHIVPPKNTRAGGQCETGRLWDVLFMFTQRAQRSEDGLTYFRVAFTNQNHGHDVVPLKAITGPGDKGEPVVTIMLPNED